MPQGIYLPEGLGMAGGRYTEGVAGMARAMADGIVLEGKAVACSADGDLTVRIGNMEGVIPYAEASLDPARPIAVLSKVGHSVCFMVTGRMGDRYLLSRRAAQQAAQQCFMENLLPGEVIRARVTHLEPFGAFVDMGCGLPSLIGIENICVSRTGHPKERFVPGQVIQAVVLSVDRAQKRVVLSHRELLGTWEENLQGIEVGQTRMGIVRGLADYGVFVELTPNLSGLAEPTGRDLESGDGVSVYIKSILPDRMKVKLMVIDRLEKGDGRIGEDHYFIRGGCMEQWQYSPDCCRSKLVGTWF